jgi:hypothetical protein
VFLDLEAAVAQRLGGPGMTRHGEIGVQSYDRFNVMVDGQTTDQAEGLPRSRQRLRH